MTATATRSQPTEARLANLTVVSTLGRFEGRQMTRHPLFWLAGLAAIGLSIFELIEEEPVLNRVSMTLAWTMAPLAVATAFLAGWAVLRARGRTDAHPPTVMPAPMSLRVSGVLVGLVWPALATFGVQLALLGWTLVRDPVTSIVWTELLVGPGYVVFAGAVSAAATRWFPHPSTPLVAVFVLAAAQVVVPYNPGNWGSEIGPAALAPIAWPENIIPYEVAFRPSGLHLAYLLGLVLVLVGVAVLGRARSGWLVLGTGLVVAGVLGPAQLGPIDESTRAAAMARLVGDEADLACEEHDGVRYCAMPGYQGWIDEWVDMVEPVASVLPPEVAEGLEVRQYPVHVAFLLDDAHIGNIEWWWVAPAAEDFRSRDVVPAESHLRAGDLSAGTLERVGVTALDCEFPCEGESQLVVRLWLATQHPEIRGYVEEDTGPGSDFATVADCMIADTWDRPGIGDVIRSNWETLTAPETTYQQAGEILGIDAPEADNELGYLEGGCP